MSPQARADQLRAAVVAHKATIRRERKALADAKQSLVQLERDCAERGIKLVVVNGGGETHGQSESEEAAP